MAFTQTQLDSIEAAIATGELKVMYDGREVTYRSIADLIRARDTIKAALQAAGAIVKTAHTSYVSRGRD